MTRNAVAVRRETAVTPDQQDSFREIANRLDTLDTSGLSPAAVESLLTKLVRDTVGVLDMETAGKVAAP